MGTRLGLHALLVALTVVACAPQEQAADQDAQTAEQRLATFDTLDFVVFSGQQWDRLGESHAEDIIVTWPDGRETTGLAQHVEDLKALFVYAPDMKISEHPIRIASGEWTAVTGVMTGTFSRPMPLPDGTSIPPTGKPFRMTMATIAHWRGDKMDHEWLFWDNHDFMRQIGLVQ